MLMTSGSLIKRTRSLDALVGLTPRVGETLVSVLDELSEWVLERRNLGG